MKLVAPHPWVSTLCIQTSSTLQISDGSQKSLHMAAEAKGMYTVYYELSSCMCRWVWFVACPNKRKCVCVCIYVCVCTCVCMYVCVHMCVHVYVCAHVCACMCVCTCVCTCVCIYVCVCTCVCMYVCVHMCVTLATCICVCIGHILVSHKWVGKGASPVIVECVLEVHRIYRLSNLMGYFMCVCVCICVGGVVR